MSGREQWEQRYRAAPAEAALPCRALAEFCHLLPAQGEALDLACGRGGNALLLARRGLRTWAWDYAPSAIAALNAEARGLPLCAEVRDVCGQPPEPTRFDVIVVSHFLDRALAPALAAALRPGGLLYYQTFCGKDGPGPRNPAFRLRSGELLDLFATLRPVVYREDGELGDTTLGWRGEAMLIARRAQ